MPKYRKKPVIIEAEQWFPGNQIDGVQEVESVFHYSYGLELGTKTCAQTAPRRVGMIKTLEGVVYAEAGDFIITGVKGEKYPCRPDIFELTYELVKEDNNG